MVNVDNKGDESTVPAQCGTGLECFRDETRHQGEWVDKLEEYGTFLTGFLRHYIQTMRDGMASNPPEPYRNVPNYNSMTELHISGGDGNTYIQLLHDGDDVSLLKILYGDGGEALKIHARVGDSSNDIYLAGGALVGFGRWVEEHQTPELDN